MMRISFGRPNSVAMRFQSLEGLVNSTEYRVRYLSAHSGPDKIEKITQMVNWISETLSGVGDRSLFHRLLHAEKKVSEAYELAIAANVRSKLAEADCTSLKFTLQEIAGQANHARQGVYDLRKRMDDADALSTAALPRAQRDANLISRALENTCFAAMRSRLTAALPGGRGLVRDRLLPLHCQLETFRLKVDSSKWRDVARVLARGLFLALRQDGALRNMKNISLEGESATICTLEDVAVERVPPPGDETSVTAIPNIRALVCRGVWSD